MTSNLIARNLLILNFLQCNIKRSNLREFNKESSDLALEIFYSFLATILIILQSSLKENEQIQDLRIQLKEHTSVFDQWRKEHFFAVFPEFVGYL